MEGQLTRQHNIFRKVGEVRTTGDATLINGTESEPTHNLQAKSSFRIQYKAQEMARHEWNSQKSSAQHSGLAYITNKWRGAVYPY